MEDTVCYLDSFEYLLKGRMVHKMKEVRPPNSKEVVAERADCEPEASAANKLMEKRPNPFNKEEESVEIPAKMKPPEEEEEAG